MPRESAGDRKKRALRIARGLARAYPDADCALRHRDPFELLISTILSAQCTDKAVNEVTPALFRRFPDAAALAAADPTDVEALIRRTGFFRQKTKSLIAASQDITETFGGKVPKTMEELLTLRGVARKTANVVLGNAFGVPGLTVDTHMKRIHGRLGLTRHEDPVKIEQDLMLLIPQKDWTLYSHRVIHHGRQCCDARKPRCEACPVQRDCPWPAQVLRQQKSPGKAGGKTARTRIARPAASRSAGRR